MRFLRTLLVLALLVSTSGCLGYRLIRPEEVEIPSYEPREVPIPADCDALVQRAARDGVEGLSEPLARRVGFCQHQQLLRAQEEEAAARRLEAHASAAGLALQVATVAIGALVAVLAWVF
ncbi:MAG TPA: hypothetical protein VHG51_03755 [Longimicrobiaceae bacterium]|nr:hypothetical protein [Longimicrobiaceae bacterium]